MKIIPILFSTPMVQAIMEDRKTQTRRVVKNNNSLYGSKYSELDFNSAFVDGLKFHDKYLNVNHIKDDTVHRVFSNIETGDILWVRETWQYSDDLELPYLYKQKELDELKPEYFKRMKWKPSIFMPKEACRNFLEVTNVRVERLHDISNEDSKSEGIENHYLLKKQGYKHYTQIEKFIPFGDPDAARTSFFSLWMSINGADSLDENPWVWVYDFKRVEMPENFLKESAIKNPKR